MFIYVPLYIIHEYLDFALKFLTGWGLEVELPTNATNRWTFAQLLLTTKYLSKMPF